MTAEDDRQARLAAALRANLRRRKGVVRPPPAAHATDADPPAAAAPKDA